MTILDFYGLPGSGKSTLSHKLYEDRRYKKIIEPSYKLDHNYHWSIRKILKILILFRLLLYRPVVLIKIYKILQNNSLMIYDFISALLNISYKYYAIFKNLNKEYIIFDQGIIQDSISICYNSPERLIDNLEALVSILPNDIYLQPIFIDVNVETCMKRMAKRASNDSRVEKKNSLYEKVFMLNQFHYCNNIINNYYTNIIVYKNN